MSITSHSVAKKPPRINVEFAKRRTLWKVLTITVLMFGFGFAMVPFYKKICEVTGVNALDQPSVQVSVPQFAVDQTRTVMLQLDANKREKDWVFRPLNVQQEIHPGALVKVEYLLENHTGKRVKAQAIPSYSPSYAGRYFQKLECFCFRQQVFEPNEVKRLPVIFRVDPALPKEVKTLTLSYTLFRIEGV